MKLFQPKKEERVMAHIQHEFFKKKFLISTNIIYFLHEFDADDQLLGIMTSSMLDTFWIQYSIGNILSFEIKSAKIIWASLRLRKISNTKVSAYKIK